LGIALDDVDEMMATRLEMVAPRGAVVADFAPGQSPAKDAGILIGDVIIDFNGTAVKNMGMLIRIVGQTRPRESVKLGIIRGGKEISIDLKIGERPAQ
jgi:serine protease Do